MLLRITNSCRMGCIHCFNDSVPSDTFMNWPVLKESVKFINRIEPMILLVSGGEPTDHPDFINMLEYILKNGKFMQLLVASNGMFLSENQAVSHYLRRKKNVYVQICNVPEYYPKKINPVKSSNFMFVNDIPGGITPLGRAATNNVLQPTRKAPLCFNFRSLTRTFQSVEQAILHLITLNKHCSPSINFDGSLSAGETHNCYRFGWVTDPFPTLLHNVLNMRCNKCGLENNLEPIYKAAIGLKEG